MACFAAPAAEAIITTIVAKSLKAKEKKVKEQSSIQGIEIENKIPFSRKLGWLNNMLWGGSALLAFEHIWHGEVVPIFPFLTSLNNPSDTLSMLYEMSTAGVGMALLVTAVWGCMLAVSKAVEKKAIKTKAARNAEV